MVLLLWSLRNHFRLLVCRAHRSPPAGLHLCVLCWWRRAARGGPAAFTSSLIDVKPATIGGVPFCYPARRQIVIGAGWRRALRRALMRGRRTVEGTFACALIDAGLELASSCRESSESWKMSGGSISPTYCTETPPQDWKRGKGVRTKSSGCLARPTLGSNQAGGHC